MPSGLKGHLFFLIYLAHPLNYFGSPRCLSGWVWEATQTIPAAAEVTLTPYSYILQHMPSAAATAIGQAVLYGVIWEGFLVLQYIEQ